MPRVARPTLKPLLALRLRRAIAMRVNMHKSPGRPPRDRDEPLVRTKSLVQGVDGELHVKAIPAMRPQSGPHGSFEQVDDALTREKFTVTQLTKAIQARKPQIHERTVRRYLSRREPLTKDAAVDLILGCWALGFRPPDDILEEVCAEEAMPPIIVFPGKSERLAVLLAAQATTMLHLTPRDSRRVKERFLELLARYERFNVTGLGRELLDTILGKIKSEYGERWEWRLHETYMAYDIGPRPIGKAGLMRDTYTVISPLGRIQALGRKPRRE